MGFFELVKSMIPDEAESLEEFTEVVVKKGCDTVMILPEKKGLNYALKYLTDIPNGKTVVFKQHLFSLPAKSLADKEEKCKAAIKLFLLGEKAAKELQAQLPIKVDLLGGDDNRPMDEDLFAMLHLAAKNLNVTV
jgi:hypothetical protein